MTEEKQTHETDKEYTPEELGSIVDVFRSVDDNAFWKRRHFYSDNAEERERNQQERADAVERVKKPLSAYDSNPTYENARRFLSLVVLDTNIDFSLEKLREMVFRAGENGEDCRSLRDRLVAQERILQGSGVTLHLKPLHNHPKDLLKYVEKHYENYRELNGELAGDVLSRMVFTNTYWTERIPIKLSKGKGREIKGYGETSTLRSIIEDNKSATLII